MRIVRRTWVCDACSRQFRTWEDEEPECPYCAAAAAMLHAPQRPPASDIPSPAILSGETKLTTAVAESAMADMGLTNMRDSVKPGENYAPPMTHAQIKMRDAAQGFWRQTGVNPAAAAGAMIPDGHAGVPKGEAMARVQRLAQKLEGIG